MLAAFVVVVSSLAASLVVVASSAASLVALAFELVAAAGSFAWVLLLGCPVRKKSVVKSD